MKTTNFFHLFFAIVILLLIITVGTAAADPEARSRFYMPVVTSGTQDSIHCDLNQSNYGSLSVNGSPQQGDPETNANMNLGYRGYEENSAARKLVTLGPVWDKKAPQFPGMFGDRRTARISRTYQRYRWDYDCDCPIDSYSPYETTVIGLAVSPGEKIYTPDSGYDIGGGYEYQVMYAGESGITLYIGRDDDYHGYVVHIDDVCVDPDLVNLYRKLHKAGREELPALGGHEAFGRALNSEIKVAVRDTGHFLDPRSRNDWWQGR